jgi:dTDP-4-amino-4,6-dideoxygalactose transaminase
VLSAKLPRLPAWNASRRALVAGYRELLDAEVAPMVDEVEGAVGVYHLAVVRVHRRDEVRAELALRGISTGIHYPTPCHLVDAYADYATTPLPVAEAAAGEILSLPLYPHLEAEQVDVVCRELNKVAREKARP